MNIRDATESDLAAMDAVDRLAVEEGSRRQHIREWVSAGRAIVAVVDEAVVGYAVLEYTFFTQGFVAMLMVEKTHRRKGVATALVSHLEESCKTDKLFTSTNESNKPMQALLQSMAYEPSGTVYNLDEGDPELFYVKRFESRKPVAAAASCLSRDKQRVATLERYEVHDLTASRDIPIEVTVHLTSGDQRWCVFATPSALASCGDWIDGTQVPFHHGNGHIILANELSDELIGRMLRQIDAQGDLVECTLPFDSDHGDYGSHG